jgi:hypothetical protein
VRVCADQSWQAKEKAAGPGPTLLGWYFNTLVAQRVIIGTIRSRFPGILGPNKKFFGSNLPDFPQANWLTTNKSSLGAKPKGHGGFS